MKNDWEGPFVVHDCFDTLHELLVNEWHLKKYVASEPTYIANMDKDIQENDGWEQKVDLLSNLFTN